MLLAFFLVISMVYLIVGIKLNTSVTCHNYLISQHGEKGCWEAKIP